MSLQNKRQENIGNTWQTAIIAFCYLMTIIILVWAIIYPTLENTHFLIKTLILIITGIGAIGIWALTIPAQIKWEKVYNERFA